MTTANTVLPHDLPNLLDRFPGATCLSLDCFDTLIWRDCHRPTNIFAGLDGVSPAQRAGAEHYARKARRLSGKGSEVSIGDIHTQLHPNGSAGSIARAVANELVLEKQHCFAFAPTVRLLEDAKARGMDTIIVSDTYLDEAQLRSLIADAAGKDVAALIDTIFCSSTFGKSKSGGLMADVLDKVAHQPGHIVHVGDNFAADVEAIAPLGVHAVHLQQFSPETKERLRIEAAVDAILHAPSKVSASTLQPHRAPIAITEPQTEDAAEALGITALGPVMFAFEEWLQAEADKLAQEHSGTVHWLFLMRDGHLPQRVHEAVSTLAETSHPAELSRFTATAAHLTDKDTIARFVDQEIGLRPESLARQLLIEPPRIARLLDGLSMEDGSLRLLKEARSGAFRKSLARKARGFADRLCAHVRSLCDPKPGDVLMLVDLGYNGTVQNRVDALLTERFGVHVAGRYLLLREMDKPQLDKSGLIDARHYAPEILEAICANVALLEQLSTKAQGSVVDYTESGEPIRRENDIKGQQSELRERVQQGVLNFATAAKSSQVRTQYAEVAAARRESAASALMRLMFLPLQTELEVIKSFEHDVNLGTDRIVPLFEPQIATSGLRQRGLFYMNGSERMYLPAEIQREPLSTRLSLLVNRRFNLPFTFQDFAGQTMALPVIYADDTSTSRQIVDAFATHDGFFTAAIPIGEGRFAVSPQFGELFDWFELDRLAFIPSADFVSGTHETLRRETAASPLFEGMRQHSGRLVHVEREDGQMLVMPPAELANQGTQFLLACTFRPIVAKPHVAAKPSKPAGEERISA